jgi:hypothetical protein
MGQLQALTGVSGMAETLPARPIDLAELGARAAESDRQSCANRPGLDFSDGRPWRFDVFHFAPLKRGSDAGLSTEISDFA